MALNSEMVRPTLHLMVGLPCSGKTTYAKALGKRKRALVLSPDPWQIALFGDDNGQSEHDMRHDTVERMLVDLAREALSIGASVVLDFGFWAKEERDFFRELAKDTGADFRIHFMDVPFDELIRRMDERNKETGGRSFVIFPEQMSEWAAQFERPTAEELAYEEWT